MKILQHYMFDGKVCRYCHEYKPIEEYYRFWSTGRIQTQCKTCVDAKNKAWNDAHPDIIRRTKERWQKAHPEVDAAKAARWRKRHPDRKRAADNRHRARKYGNGGRYTAKQFADLCEVYGNRCLCCGAEQDLTADHVVPLARGGSNDISNIQPLCRKCNSRKGAKTIDYRRGE